MHFLSLGLSIFFLIMAFVFLTVAISSYNGLISLRNQVDRAWSNIDVLLKQRFDMIPQMVSVCEQYTQYERGTFERLAAARQAYGTAMNINDKIKASAEMTQAMRGIFALAEAYPELKSSDQFAELERAVKEMESQIADRRELYNDTATSFNTKCLQFPDMFFAGMLRYSPVALYHVAENEKAMPDLHMKLPAA